MIYLLIIPTLLISAVISYVIVSQKAKRVNGEFTSRLSDLEKYNAKVRRGVSELRTLVDNQADNKDAYTLIAESCNGNKYRFNNVIKYEVGSELTYGTFGMYSRGDEDTIRIYTDSTNEPHAIVDRADIRVIYKEDAKCGCMRCGNISKEE